MSVETKILSKEISEIFWKEGFHFLQQKVVLQEM